MGRNSFPDKLLRLFFYQVVHMGSGTMCNLCLPIVVSSAHWHITGIKLRSSPCVAEGEPVIMYRLETDIRLFAIRNLSNLTLILV